MTTGAEKSAVLFERAWLLAPSDVLTRYAGAIPLPFPAA